MGSTLSVEIRDWAPGIHPVVGRCTVVLPDIGIGIAGVSIVRSVGHHIAWPTRPRQAKPVRRPTGGIVSDAVIIEIDETAHADLRHAIGTELRRLGHIR